MSRARLAILDALPLAAPQPFTPSALRFGQPHPRRRLAERRRAQALARDGLNYRTPSEVAQTWDGALGDLQTRAT